MYIVHNDLIFNPLIFKSSFLNPTGYAKPYELTEKEFAEFSSIETRECLWSQLGFIFRYGCIYLLAFSIVFTFSWFLHVMVEKPAIDSRRAF